MGFTDSEKEAVQLANVAPTLVEAPPVAGGRPNGYVRDETDRTLRNTKALGACWCTC